MISFYESDLWRSFGQGHPGGRELTQELLEKSGLEKGAMVLDLFCGSGDSVALMTELSFSAFGFDRKNVIAYAKQKHPTLPENIWFCSNNESKIELPFEDQIFDALLCECSFSLIEDSSQLLDEVKRILKPQGYFLLSDLSYGEPFDLIDFKLVDWRDKTAYLKEFFAAWLWETGSLFPGTCRASHYFSAIYQILSTQI